MAKEIDETKLNYNKYPGEHVIAVDNIVTIGGDKTFHIVRDFRDAFDAEKLEQRFSDVFDKYDYLVGDFGFEQLRLKGFFSMSRKKMAADTKIDHLEDYLNEYCNYGCPYFVLRRVRARDLKNEQAYESERVFEENPSKAKFDKPRRKRNRNRNKNYDNKEKVTDKKRDTDSFVMNEKRSVKFDKKQNKPFSEKKVFDSSVKNKKTRKTTENDKKQPKKSFVIRERRHDA
ncbi:YutD family protein [Lactococcus nasutitermitis]|uniref:YutD family protein n=1 Tax=Lactococcus nasutitermitis TaxID=1652957 RepID=A0ABV9JE34_9LACT|nr:YutD-like domain-containing protein [Lactococcus nasutitermitis]